MFQSQKEAKKGCSAGDLEALVLTGSESAEEPQSHKSARLGSSGTSNSVMSLIAKLAKKEKQRLQNRYKESLAALKIASNDEAEGSETEGVLCLSSDAAVPGMPSFPGKSAYIPEGGKERGNNYK